MKNQIQSLFWGILAAGAALFVELVITSFFDIDALESAGTLLVLIIALTSLTEEVFKYIVVIRSIDPISFGRSALLNSWIAGLGFSIVEILFFYQKVLSENLIFDKIDLIKVGLLHIFTFGIFGYKVATKEDNKIDISLILALTLIHLAYNMTVQYSETIVYPAGSLILIILFLYNVFSFIAVNKRLADE